MKKILIFTLVAFAATMTMSAQKGDFSVGGQFNYASKNSMVGLGVNLEYEFIDNFRIEPEFIYYFENEGISAINANLNLHYLIKTGSNFVLYPMAGFSYARFDDSEDRFGANIGFGAEYRITNNFRFYTEERIQVLKDWNQSVTSLGVRYKF
ncbi:MAG: porin family protein [Muribaculaceae bacterium]|nr:porin family protein [Muribaculaceae bacterium]